jgi:5'-3' exonuclease
MKMKHPNAIDHASVLRWMKENNIRCVGLVAEADQQMIQLERDGVVDGIISEDGDEVALGAKLLL